MKLPLLVVLLASVLAACTSTPPAAPRPGAAAEPSVPAETNTPAVAAPSEPDWVAQAMAQAPAPVPGEGWKDLFDGQTLHGWRETRFSGPGEIQVRAGALVFDMGNPFTGLNYTNAFPTNNYEIALEAMRVNGTDFFCGLTLPVREQQCSLIVGGWGGSLVGISSINGMDASENETTKFVPLEKRRWYRIRVRVSNPCIEAWIDDEKVVDLGLEDRRLSVRPGEIELSRPVGLASWQTGSIFREIRLRRVDGPAEVKKRRY